MADGPPPSSTSGVSSRHHETVIGRHDGHLEGHLNCVALRHGWSRNFSLAPDEVSGLSYETLTRALEFHTLNLRPMMLRVFVEHPPSSGTWAKIRSFKNDGSLQSVLLRAFFEERLNDGVVTVMEIRDGADRRDETDSLSLRSVGSRVGSRIFHPKERSEDKKRSGGWLSNLLSRVKAPRKTKDVSASESHTQLREVGEDGDDDVVDIEDHPGSRDLQDTQKKPRTQPSIFQSGLFSYFMSPAPPPRSPTPPPKLNEEEEAEVMRKRGWMPPGMVKRQVSLRQRLSTRKQRKDKTQNPFLGGKKVEDPFNDPHHDGVPVSEADIDEEPHDVDDFFEMERPERGEGVELGNVNAKDKAWSRFTPKRNRSKGKGKGKATDKDNTPTPPQTSSINSDVE